MKILLVVSILALAVQSREYHYDKPAVEFSQEDKPHRQPIATASQPSVSIIKGKNGKNFEVEMAESRQIYETRLPPKEEVFIVKHIHQTTYPREQQFLAKTYNINTSPNPGSYGNFQQTFNNQQQQHLNLNSNPFNTNVGVNNFNQLQQQRNSQQQQQQQYYPRQIEHYLQQPQRNNNLPNANNLLNDLVNNHKYVSQSETAQLDVYPYKQINGNPRPFTRIVTKCDATGQCEPQNAAEGGNGGSDFHHQQVLKQSKAQVTPSSDKCQNKFNYQFTGNALTSNAAKAQRGIPIIKGTDLRDRRLFAYNEVVIPQYPHN
ncbi:uncharacterized protein ACRADG_012153 [Cochliomyia hominivorax]